MSILIRRTFLNEVSFSRFIQIQADSAYDHRQDLKSNKCMYCVIEWKGVILQSSLRGSMNSLAIVLGKHTSDDLLHASSPN